MIVEIRKAGFTNKGAELMVYSILQKMRARYPDAVFVMAPTALGGSRPFHEIVKLGMYPKVWLWFMGFQLGFFAKFLPKKLREMYGLVLDCDVDVVLDASGFNYSDQWGVNGSRELARASKIWKRANKLVVLLPQAFGPFDSIKIKPFVKCFSENVDLIFTREIDSYRYLTSIVGEKENVRMSHDFTNLVKGEIPDDFIFEKNRIALIPNYRMIDKTDQKVSDAYIPFMVNCAKYLIGRGCMPFVLVHEGDKDADLAESISNAVGGVPIVRETNALRIKGIIGSCDAVIGSRFHGVVSALSQGVPTLATGWSHKYFRLFEDYDYKDGLLSVTDPKEILEGKLDSIIDECRSNEIKEKLLIKSEQLKSGTESMWSEVFLLIDDKLFSRS